MIRNVLNQICMEHWSSDVNAGRSSAKHALQVLYVRYLRVTNAGVAEWRKEKMLVLEMRINYAI